MSDTEAQGVCEVTPLQTGASVKYRKGGRYREGVIRKVEDACVHILGDDRKFHTIDHASIVKVFVPGSKGGAR